MASSPFWYQTDGTLSRNGRCKKVSCSRTTTGPLRQRTDFGCLQSFILLIIAPGRCRLSGGKRTFIKQEFQQRVGLLPASSEPSVTSPLGHVLFFIQPHLGSNLAVSSR